jgi:DNA-binding response OmpR family regulator
MKTIVVVDDEFSLADVLAATLSDLGFRVYAATNGARGLELMDEHEPDLVILDYMMPLLDGAGVLTAMQKDGRLAQVPVIMMSSLPESSVRARCAVYAGFLRKPFSIEALIDTVNATLDSGPAVT